MNKSARDATIDFANAVAASIPSGELMAGSEMDEAITSAKAMEDAGIRDSYGEGYAPNLKPGGWRVLDQTAQAMSEAAADLTPRTFRQRLQDVVDKAGVVEQASASMLKAAQQLQKAAREAMGELE